MLNDETSRWLRRLLTVGLLVALVLPLVRSQDGLPFSTYPMYSSVRSGETSLVTAVGVANDGGEVTLSISVIAATRDPLIAESYLRDAVASGDADLVCKRIADRASDVASVEVVTERHDALRRLQGQPSLLKRTVHATCSPS